MNGNTSRTSRIPRTQRISRRSSLRSAVVALLSTLALTAMHSLFLRRTVGASPAQGAPPATPAATAAKAAATPAAQQRARQVTAALTRLLRARVSSPGGQLKLIMRPTARAGEGHFSEIYLAGRPVQVKKLRISEFSLRARDVRLDAARLLRDGSLHTLASRTSLRAVVTESDLTALLARGKRTAAMKLRVKYTGDRIRVSGNWNWGWFNGPVVGVGRLRLAPGHKVNFDILSLKLNGAEVPDFVKTRFSERLNPVISYDDLPFQPRFRSLTFRGSKAILAAG